jgi:TetR/AcrR family transcriptional regulator, copper-responsive repressor
MFGQGIFCEMVQKSREPPSGGEPPSDDGAPPPKKRGRPRAFAPEVALSRALDTFRDGGFAATSLDDLSAAMGINRPSLYGAFGDKRDLFLKAYAHYREEVTELVATAFDPALTLRQSLDTIFAILLDLYLAGENGPRGCFTVMTAGSEAMADREIRDTVLRALGGTDKALCRLFERAVVRGDLPANADVELLVQLVASTMHTVALRARATTPRADLEEMARRVIDLACSGIIVKSA